MPLRILTVCTANVCRSPMAAALLTDHCRKNGLEAVVTSAGTTAVDLDVDPDAVTVMNERGLTISDHIPRQLTRSIVADDGADLIVTMTREHLRTVSLLGPGAFKRSFTARELERRITSLSDSTVERGSGGLLGWREALGVDRYARDLVGDDVNDDVDDPYGRSLAQHRQVAGDLDALTAAIAHSIAGW